ncbi:MAG: hypothetical protein ACREAE_04460, partial [Nitrosopumilaceae archaeon]
MAKCFLCKGSAGIINGKSPKSFLLANGLTPPEGMSEDDVICGKCLSATYGNWIEIKNIKILGASSHETFRYAFDYDTIAKAVDETLEELEWKTKFGSTKNGHIEAKPPNTWKTFSGFVIVDLRNENKQVVIDVESISSTKMDMGQNSD